MDMIAAYTKLLSEMEAVRLESNQYTLIVGKGIMQYLQDAHLTLISDAPYYHLTHAPNSIKVILSNKVDDYYYKLFKDSDLHVDAAYKISKLKMLDIEYIVHKNMMSAEIFKQLAESTKLIESVQNEIIRKWISEKEKIVKDAIICAGYDPTNEFITKNLHCLNFPDRIEYVLNIENNKIWLCTFYNVEPLPLGIKDNGGVCTITNNVTYKTLIK